MKLPPITDADGKLEMVGDVTFSMGDVAITVTTEGAGAFLEIKTHGCADEKWRIDASELLSLARWAGEACKELDEHNKENGK